MPQDYSIRNSQMPSPAQSYTQDYDEYATLDHEEQWKEDGNDSRQYSLVLHDQEAQQAQLERDKPAKSTKLEGVAEQEELEIEEESMASVLNPLDCYFRSVVNIFGVNGRLNTKSLEKSLTFSQGDTNLLSTVALCLMAFCNSLYGNQHSDTTVTNNTIPLSITLKDIPVHVLSHLKSVCMLLERTACDSTLWKSYSYL